MWDCEVGGDVPKAATTSGIESNAESAGVGLDSSFAWPLMLLAVPLAGSPLSSAGIVVFVLSVHCRSMSPSSLESLKNPSEAFYPSFAAAIVD